MLSAMKLSHPKPDNPMSRRSSLPARSGMSLARALLTLGLAATASLALSLAIRSAEPSGADEPPAPSGSLEVQWAFDPESLDSLVNESQAVVVARVDAVRPGEGLVLDPQAGVTVPTQRIDLTVDQQISGQAPSSFSVFKLGGSGVQPSDDPAYEVGESYMLFVRPRLNDQLTAPAADGTYLAVAPEGRYTVGSGQLDAVVSDPVADQLDGATVSEAAEEVQAADSSGVDGG
jgi:hypothetical protein